MKEYDIGAIVARIKDEKNRQGYTNKTLSEASGIPLGTINRILGGQAEEPKLPFIFKIADTLKISANYLILGDDSSSMANGMKEAPSDESKGARDAIIDDAEKLAQAFEERPALKELFDILIQLNDSNLRHFAAVLKDLRQL